MGSAAPDPVSGRGRFTPIPPGPGRPLFLDPEAEARCLPHVPHAGLREADVVQIAVREEAQAASEYLPHAGSPEIGLRCVEHYQEVAWELSDLDGSTELTVREVNLRSEEARAVSEQGWRTALAGLKELLEG